MVVIMVLEAPSTPQAASAFARLAPSTATQLMDILDIVPTYKVPAKIVANASISARDPA
jgi:hypothetical protein